MDYYTCAEPSQGLQLARITKFDKIANHFRLKKYFERIYP